MLLTIKMTNAKLEAAAAAVVAARKAKDAAWDRIKRLYGRGDSTILEGMHFGIPNRAQIGHIYTSAEHYKIASEQFVIMKTLYEADKEYKELAKKAKAAKKAVIDKRNEDYEF